MTRTRADQQFTIPRAADWRDAAACRDQDPELWFPKGHEGPWQLVIADAKAVCSRCPVRDACLQYAIGEGVDSGIFGGLTEQERRNLRRRTKRAETREVEQIRRPRTLYTVWQARTKPLADGHLGWTGSRQVQFAGTYYTPKRAAFIATRGREPDGQVLSVCGLEGCIRPEHVADARERKAKGLPHPRQVACGTQSAYARHVRNGEEPDAACLQANRDSHTRWRETGSTKASA